MNKVKTKHTDYVVPTRAVPIHRREFGTNIKSNRYAVYRKSNYKVITSHKTRKFELKIICNIYMYIYM